MDPLPPLCLKAQDLRGWGEPPLSKHQQHGTTFKTLSGVGRMSDSTSSHLKITSNIKILKKKTTVGITTGTNQVYIVESLAN